MLDSANPNPPTSPNRRDWVAALAVAVAAAALRLIAARRGLWYDEYLTLLASRLPLGELVAERLAAGHSPLYFLYTKAALTAGDADPVLRATSLVFVPPAVLALTALARDLDLRRHLPALWALCLLSPYWIAIGTAYRYMMMLTAVGAALTWAVVAYCQTPSRRAGALAAIAGALFLLLHGSAAPFMIGLCIFAIWQRRSSARRESWAHTLARLWPLWTAWLVAAPLLIYLGAHLVRDKRPISVAWTLVAQTCETVFGDMALWADFLGFSPRWAVAFCALLLTVAIILAARSLLRAGNVAALRLLLCALAAQPAALLATRLAHEHARINARYLSLFALPALLVLAVAWSAPAPRWLRATFRSALVLAWLAQAGAALWNPGSMHRESAQWVAHHAGAATVVVFSDERANGVALDRAGLPDATPRLAFRRLDKDAAEVEARLRDAFRLRDRGLAIVYFTKSPVRQVAEELAREGFFTALRRWQPSPSVTLYALARGGEAQAWLADLPDPPRLRGPANGWQ